MNRDRTIKKFTFYTKRGHHYDFFAFPYSGQEFSNQSCIYALAQNNGDNTITILEFHCSDGLRKPISQALNLKFNTVLICEIHSTSEQLRVIEDFEEYEGKTLTIDETHLPY